MAISKPQVAIFQEFTAAPVEPAGALRAHLSGPHGLPHRYGLASEKATIGLGAYNRAQARCYPWPGRSAGGKIDRGYTKIFLDDALLLYFEDLIGDASGGRGTVQPVAARRNWIQSDAVSFRTNGSYARSDLLLDRDVAIGDAAYLRGVSDPLGACTEIELWTSVAGFASDPVAAIVGAARTDAGNTASQEASTTIDKTGGPDNCVTATADGSSYTGLASGQVCETYTVEVIKSSVAGCNAARLRVLTASGADDADEVEPADFGSPTTIGSQGLTVTFDLDTGACETAAEAAGVAANELIAGQKWTVEVCQDFEAVCATSGGGYTGATSDVYLITVTKGGLWADLPAISVTTAKGLDSSGPAEVTAANTDVPVGTHGLTIRFVDCFGSDSAAASSAGDPFGGDSDVAGLRAGDKFYITVTSSANGPVRTLILRDDVPADLADATDLDLRLFIRRDIEVTERRVSSPPDVQWSQEATQICLEAGMTAYDASWTEGGVAQAMPVWSGQLYAQYREWLPGLAETVTTISSLADLAALAGPLHPDNPLKYGFAKALENSNGAAIKGTAVADPANIDSWVDALARLTGRDDLYTVVPLTFDTAVFNLYTAYVADESGPEISNFKALVMTLLARSEQLASGQSSPAAQLLRPTSTDGEAVLAILEDDPESTGTQFTRLRCTSGNAGFLTYHVRPGDVARYLFASDAWGEASYTEFIVDEVLSENSLLLLDGHGAAISEPQKLEIWHPLNKEEILVDLQGQAQAFASNRVVAVWPDYLGADGLTVPGYFLAAAVAGKMSGVASHAPLTHLEIAGFDDYSRSVTFFTPGQLDTLQDGGVWIVTEDRDGTPHTFDALNTDVSDLKHRTESVRRNVDWLSYDLRNLLSPYVGRANVTDDLLLTMRSVLDTRLRDLTTATNTDLGPKVVSYAIRVLQQHPVLLDHIEIVLDLVPPFPANRIELHMVI